jgi:hypothetical protein
MLMQNNSKLVAGTHELRSLAAVLHDNCNTCVCYVLASAVTLSISKRTSAHTTAMVLCHCVTAAWLQQLTAWWKHVCSTPTGERIKGEIQEAMNAWDVSHYLFIMTHVVQQYCYSTVTCSAVLLVSAS